MVDGSALAFAGRAFSKIGTFGKAPDARSIWAVAGIDVDAALVVNETFAPFGMALRPGA